MGLTYTFRKRVFLAWDECRRGAKKDNINTEDRKTCETVRRFNVMEYWQHKLLRARGATAVYSTCVTVGCVCQHVPLSTTSHTSTLTTSSVAEGHRESPFNIHVVGHRGETCQCAADSNVDPITANTRRRSCFLYMEESKQGGYSKTGLAETKSTFVPWYGATEINHPGTKRRC